MTTPGSLAPNPIDWRNLIQAGRDLLNQQLTGHTLTREHARRAISIGAGLIGTPTHAASTRAICYLVLVRRNGCGSVPILRNSGRGL